MSTSDKHSTVLESISLMAVVSCVLTAAWFVVSNLIA